MSNQDERPSGRRWKIVMAAAVVMFLGYFGGVLAAIIIANTSGCQ